MPFGLKNTGATYERLMDKVFNHLMGRCVEVYVDELVKKSPSRLQHSKDLVEMFTALRKNNLRLNPENCIFWVDDRKFLCFTLTQQGIEVNSEKYRAIIEMTIPTSIKEVQQLIGRLTAISRFLPKLVDKTRPIIHLLKKSVKFF